MLERVKHMFGSAVHANDIVLTGPPRSGTTLCCVLLNKLDNAVALNEPECFREIKGVPPKSWHIEETFIRKRREILDTGRTTHKLVNGKLNSQAFSRSASGQRDKQFKQTEIHIEKQLDRDFFLIIKKNVRFRVILSELISQMSCFAVVRNPLAILASWNTIRLQVSKGRHVLLTSSFPEFGKQLGSVENVLQRQVMILDKIFEGYDSLQADQVISYEDIVASGGSALSVIDPAAEKLDEVLEDKNTNSIYSTGQIEEIADALLKHGKKVWSYYTQEDVLNLKDQLCR